MRQPVYHDFWVKTCGSLLVSHLIESLGREESWFVLLQRESYYVALVSGFVITWGLWTLIKGITIWLDRQYDWFAQPLPRLLLQTLGGLMLPSVLAYLLTTWQMRVFFDQDILLTSFLHTEFPVAVLILLMVNLYYFTYWIYDRWQLAQDAGIVRIAGMARGADVSLVNEPAQDAGRPAVLLVSKGRQTKALSVNDVVYIFRDGDYNYIRTRQNEDFLTSQTLDELTASLSPRDFFRVNRQLTAHRQACQSFSPLDFGKLQLNLMPPFADVVIVSQKRAKAFREWLAGQLAQH